MSTPRKFSIESEIVHGIFLATEDIFVRAAHVIFTVATLAIAFAGLLGWLAWNALLSLGSERDARQGALLLRDIARDCRWVVALLCWLGGFALLLPGRAWRLAKAVDRWISDCLDERAWRAACQRAGAAEEVSGLTYREYIGQLQTRVAAHAA